MVERMAGRGGGGPPAREKCAKCKGAVWEGGWRAEDGACKFQVCCRLLSCSCRLPNVVPLPAVRVTHGQQSESLPARPCSGRPPRIPLACA